MVILSSALALALALAAAPSAVDAFVVLRPRSAASVPSLLRTSFRMDDEPPIDWSKYSPAAEVEAPPPPEVADYPRAEDFAAVTPEDVLPPPLVTGGDEPIDWSNWAPSSIQYEYESEAEAAYEPHQAQAAAAYEAAYETPLPPPPPPVDVSVPEYSVEAAPPSAEVEDDHGWHFEPVDSSDYTSSRPYRGESGETMDRATRDSGEITYDQESNEIHEKIFTYALAVPFAAFLIGILNGIGLFGH